MTLDELKFNSDINGIRVFQTQRGEVDASNPYSQWNLCDYTGDDALRVLNARISLCQQLGINLDHLIIPRQTHSINVLVIDEEFIDASIEAQDEMLEDVDALVCTVPGICIGVNTADCVPMAFADPKHKIIAVAHAGWKGTMWRIAQKTKEKMKGLGSNPCDISVTMGASICQDCFEVGDEVVSAFEKEGFDMSLIMKRNSTTGKAHINLQEANRQILIAAGVPVQNITLPEHCSRCENDRYFSARRLGINSGRTFTGIIMQN